MADGWLEQRTRIPFAGIVAIVVVVAIVSIFLRAGLDKIMDSTLPDSTVEVSEGETVNVRGSASFGGERDIQLIYKERLEGMLTMNGVSSHFLIDVPERVLVLTEGPYAEEILLSPTDDGVGLAATFEHDGVQTTVIVYPAERTLFWRAAGGFAIEAAITDVFTYEGSFLFNSDQYGFTFRPATADAVIVHGTDSWTIPLARSADMYSGTWHAASSHPVRIETDRLTAIVGELW